jgi:hypothetical protein
MLGGDTVPDAFAGVRPCPRCVRDAPTHDAPQPLGVPIEEGAAQVVEGLTAPAAAVQAPDGGSCMPTTLRAYAGGVGTLAARPER